MNNEKERETGAYKTLTLDTDYYQSLLDDPQIPGDRKRELIETLWNIVVQFVDYGYSVHPLQQAQCADEQVAISDIVRSFVEAAHPERTENILEGADL